MHDVDWKLWTGWMAFDSPDRLPIPQGPGAYIIAASQPINRAVGSDPDGYLDVGESDKLANRLKNFHRCIIHRRATGHMAGWRFAFFRFERQFPHTALRVRWRAAATKQDAYAAEGQVLLSYLRRHCELPPLNYKFNWQMFKTHGWDILDQDVVPAAEPGTPCT